MLAVVISGISGGVSRRTAIWKLHPKTHLRYSSKAELFGADNVSAGAQQSSRRLSAG
jgi:hypothetical protein